MKSSLERVVVHQLCLATTLWRGPGNLSLDKKSNDDDGSFGYLAFVVGHPPRMDLRDPAQEQQPKWVQIYIHLPARFVVDDLPGVMDHARFFVALDAAKCLIWGCQICPQKVKRSIGSGAGQFKGRLSKMI